MEHIIKILPQYFTPAADGTKPFEVRQNDRGYQKGDTVFMEEIVSAVNPKHTGRVIKAIVTYVTNYGQPKGQVIFGFRVREIFNSEDPYNDLRMEQRGPGSSVCEHEKGKATCQHPTSNPAGEECKQSNVPVSPGEDSIRSDDASAPSSTEGGDT